MAESVLLVDDDPAVLRAVAAFLEEAGYEVMQESTGEDGMTAFERQRPDVVVLDLRLPDISGLDVLAWLKEQDAAVVLLTGHADVETAVRAMQLGAENFLTKPVEMPHLTAVLSRVLDKVRLRREVQHLRARAGSESIAGTMGVSPGMRELEEHVALLAQSERTTVLITGESGTGKGRVARLVHQYSPRAEAPFVDVNCAGLTSTFLASELFGHEKGAFTDAKESRQGLFELAHRGTLFLDEIGDLGLDLQPKLLTAIETRRFRRLGGSRELSVDVRLVTATNRDLVKAVRDGTFREDLYYRIGVSIVHLPPVRERSREDRLELLRSLHQELLADVPGAPGEITTEALERLVNFNWPGNVREMRNALERALILAGGADAIAPRHLPADIRGGGGGVRRHQPTTLKESEQRQIERALKHHQGNRTHTARELGISRVTLLKKIREYGLDS